MLISFEGIDGCGKSTQARLLSTWLLDQGRTVVELREPGGTPLGEAVRALLLDPNADIAASAELFLFAAARAQLVEHVIRPALEAGHMVVADRFTDSTLAYQGGGRSVASQKELAAVNHLATAGLKPDLTFWLDIPLNVAAARRKASELDRMERAGPTFYERVAESYQQVAVFHPNRIVRVDATEDIASIHGTIHEVVAARLESLE